MCNKIPWGRGRKKVSDWPEISDAWQTGGVGLSVLGVSGVGGEDIWLVDCKKEGSDSRLLWRGAMGGA